MAPIFRIHIFQYRLILLLSVACISINQNVQAQIFQVSFLNDDGMKLNATLSVPDGKGPFPVIIFVHGSGPNDRDQTIPLVGGNSLCIYPKIYNDTVRIFKDLAHVLRDNKIAVFRYDKRSFTYRTQINQKFATPYDYISDAHYAIEYIKKRTEIDTNFIILLGHSQGGNLIPIIANQRNDISGIVAIGTAASSIDTLMATQIKKLYLYCLKDTISAESEYKTILSNFSKIRAGRWNADTPYFGVYPKFWNDWINMTDSAIINYKSVSIPILFLHAMEDFNIPIEDAQKFVIRLSDNNNFQLIYLKGLNHFFTTNDNVEVSPVVSEKILDWIQKNVVNKTSKEGLTEH